MSFAGPSRLSSIAIQPLKTATRTPRSLVQQRFASNSRVLQNGVRPPSSPPLSKNLSKRPEGTVEAVSEDSRSVTEARLAVEDKFRRRVGRSAAKPPQRTSRLLAYIGWGGSIMAAFWMILYEDFGPNEHVFSPFRRVYSQITDAVLGVTPYEKSTLGFQYASIPNRSKAETDLSDEDGEAYIRSLEEEFVKPAREKLMQEQAQYK